MSGSGQFLPKTISHYDRGQAEVVAGLREVQSGVRLINWTAQSAATSGVLILNQRAGAAMAFSSNEWVIGFSVKKGSA
jgi:hypothetical protein